MPPNHKIGLEELEAYWGQLQQWQNPNVAQHDQIDSTVQVKFYQKSRHVWSQKYTI